MVFQEQIGLLSTLKEVGVKEFTKKKVILMQEGCQNSLMLIVARSWHSRVYFQPLQQEGAVYDWYSHILNFIWESWNNNYKTPFLHLGRKSKGFIYSFLDLKLYNI